MDIKKSLAAGVLDLQPYKAGKTIAQISREIGVDVSVKLSSNENPLGTSPKALAVFKDPAALELNLYPDASAVELRATLATKLGIDADCIVCGNGSNDILEIAATLTLRPGRKAVYAEHGFIVYRLATLARGATPVVIPAKNYGHDLDEMAKACMDKDVSIVFVANPNNPTGTHHEYEAITKFLDQVPQSVLVVLDEAYFEYVYEGAGEVKSLIEKYPNLIITRTFSKIYGLAGLRIGYGMANTQLLDLFNRVRQPFNANACAQKAAVAALGDDDFVDRARQLNDDGQMQLMTGLANLGYVTISSSGNFIAFLAGNSEISFKAALKGGVIIRQIDEYGLKGWLRATVGTKEQNDQLLNALPGPTR